MERTYIRNEECQNFLNDLELLTKEEIIESVSMFFDQTDMEATGNMNEPEDRYMVNEFGRIKRTLLNRLKIMVNRQVRHKQLEMENYIGLILDERNDHYTIGYRQTSDLEKLREWKKEMLECSNVVDCKIVKVEEIK
jgi:hypothetical protein